MISLKPDPCPTEIAGQWHAHLALGFNRTARGCRLQHYVRQGPLYVQKAFYPEGDELAHVYLLHPPGGLVSGDRLDIDVTLQENARVLMTTPGAARVYRARKDRSLQRQRTAMVLGPGASMEYLPQETIIFPSACAQLATHFDLAESSHLIAWDICCLGLPASQLRFDDGEFSQRLTISVGGRLMLNERFELSSGNRALSEASVGLQAQAVTALMVAGPLPQVLHEDDLLTETLRQCIADAKPAGLCAVSKINGLLTARYLGPDADEARRLFVQLWQILRPALLGRTACAPRIWAT